ncbi:MAG: DUF1428 family protein [Pseudomonadota bacterium]
MSYVDGFVIAVPTANKEAYRELATKLAPIFKENGALRVVECWADDVSDGEVTSFPMAVKCEPHETVAFAWIEWPSREARDAGNKKVFEDPRLHQDELPFDGKRMIFGGFEPILDH